MSTPIIRREFTNALDGWGSFLEDVQREAIRRFCEAVEREAQRNYHETGNRYHYHAMQKVLKEL